MRRRLHPTWLKRIRDALATLVGSSSIEEALRASEQAHRELLEQAPDAIFLASAEGGFVEVNERACELLGYSRQELLGRKIADVLTPEAIGVNPNARMQALREGKTLLSERELLHASGSRVPVEISTRLLSNGRFQGIARDITARKEADAALHRSEERLRLALEAAGVGIWERDFATGESIWSATTRTHLGISPEAPPTLETFVSTIHPEDRDRAVSALTRGENGVLRCQFRVVWPDRSLRHLISLGRLSLDRNGQPRRMVGTLRDITNRVTAQAKLLASEAQLRAIVDTAPDCVQLVDRDGHLLEVNPAGLAIMEAAEPDDLRGIVASTLVVPEHRAAYDALTAMAFRGESGSGEYDVVGLRGTRRSLETRVAPLRDQSGEIVAALAMCRDVTDRKRTQAALHASEELMRSVLEQTPIVLFATDKNGVFTLCRGKVLGSMSRQPDDLNGQSVFEVYRDDLTITSSMRRALAGETVTYSTESQGRVFDCTCTPMFDGSRIVGLSGVATDITERRQAEKAVRQLEQQNRLLIENANDVVIAYEPNGRITFVNQRWQTLSGYTAEQALQMSIGDVLHPEDRDMVLTNLRNRLAGGDVPSNYPMRILRADGELRWVEANVSLIRDGADVLGLQAFVRDVTERYAVEEDRGRLAAIVESSQDAIISRTLDGIITSWNRGAEQLYGYAAHEAIGKHIRILVPEDERAGSSDILQRIKNGEYVDIAETERMGRDGRRVHISVTISPIRDHSGRVVGAASIARDVTERKRAQQALAQQARHDALTGLPNRLHFRERLDGAIMELRNGGTPLAVVLLDLDRFKEVNDALGHGVGDAVLQQVADRLRRTLRADDTIARLGGDEFALLLAGTDQASALGVAAKIRATLAEPIEVGGLTLDIGASIGVALGPQHGHDEATLLRRADLAMYAAKRAGEGISLYAPALDRDNAERLALTSELRGAIERDELVLHYQPKVALVDGRIIGVEALVRWQHPTRGLLRPDQFIPIAEQAGLIEPLTYWVLHTARSQQTRWQAEGVELNVAANLSAQSLRDSRLSAVVEEVLGRHPEVRARFELELTESMLMSDPARAGTLLAGLRALGVRIAVDDFGTGYSSLAYLKRLPIDDLKIDRYFLRDMASDPRDRALVQATIDLGHTLGLRVVAEGVEDAASLELLQRMGCDDAQGYYISRPATADAIRHWAQSWSAQHATDLPRAA